MILKASPLFLFLALILVTPTTANARCAPLDDSYFLSCESGNCRPEFRAKQIRPGTSVCGRRFVIEPIPEWAVKSLGMLLHETHGSSSSGIYQISSWYNLFGTAPDVTAPLIYDDTKIRIERLPLQDPSALRVQWQNRAKWDLFGEWAWYSLDLGIFLVLLWVLYRSGSRSVCNVRAFFSQIQPARKIWRPLLTQLVLFFIGFIGAASYSFYTQPSIMYLAPAVLVVWLMEAAVYVYLRFKVLPEAQST